MSSVYLLWATNLKVPIDPEHATYAETEMEALVAMNEWVEVANANEIEQHLMAGGCNRCASKPANCNAVHFWEYNPDKSKTGSYHSWTSKSAEYQYRVDKIMKHNKN